MTDDAPAEPARLTAADVHAMLLADRDVQVAVLTAERDQARLAYAEAEMKARLTTIAAKALESAAAADAAKKAHAKVVAGVAERYAIDWRCTAFCPESGELVPLPHSEPPPCP